MLTIRRTQVFQHWLDGLRDERAKRRIASRILRAEGGNLGDHKVLDTPSEAIGEMRIDYGPGYRPTSAVAGRLSSSCCAAATSAPRIETSSGPATWPRRSNDPRNRTL